MATDATHERNRAENWKRKAKRAIEVRDGFAAEYHKTQQQLAELREAVREHRNCLHRIAEDDQKLYATLDRIEGTDNG